jgi:UDP-GlcNAc:undecaprenyl-phosphate/decaprenyl-phosphate GlcNAc-1-phosphate transferase
LIFSTSLIIVIFCLSFCLIYFIQKIYINKNITDKITSRSSHVSLATRSGGLSIFLTVFIISTYYYLRGYEIYDFSIIVPISMLTVVGLYDDLYSVDFKLKFIFQIIFAKIIIDNGFIIDNLHGVFGLFEIGRLFAQFLTILIIVAIINAVNFIDGIDGLAISITILFIILFEFFASSNTSFYNLSILIISSLAPLYYFNFKKESKVFLGDSGSLLLGGIVSIFVVNILSNYYLIKPQFDLHKILFVISILFYPIIDIIRIFFLRLIKGKSPFQPDNNHIHHLLLKRTNNHFYTTLIITIISIFFLILIQILFK